MLSGLFGGGVGLWPGCRGSGFLGGDCGYPAVYGSGRGFPASCGYGRGFPSSCAFGCGGVGPWSAGGCNNCGCNTCGCNSCGCNDCCGCNSCCGYRWCDCDLCSPLGGYGDGPCGGYVSYRDRFFCGC